MSHVVPVTVACTAIADDNGMRALRDLSIAADGLEHLVIGGQMVRLLRHVYGVAGIPRVTSDADTGIDVDVAGTNELHDRLGTLGYVAVAGNRYEFGARAVDLLVPTEGRPGQRFIGERAFDGTPGLRLALASPRIDLFVTARLTDGEHLGFSVPIPDVEAAFVLKILAWTVRNSERDVMDLETLLEIVARGPNFLASRWRMDEPGAVKSGERCDAARAAARMIASPPGTVPARVRALLRRHVAVSEP